MTTSPRASTGMPVTVERAGPVPMAAQIAVQFRDAVTSGVLGAGQRLPSTRELAAVLGVSRTVVTTAYAQLFAEGWLEGRHGSGTYVADGAAPGAPVSAGTVSAIPLPRGRRIPPGEGADHDAPGALIELRPGIPWAAGIDAAVWRRAWRYAGTRPPSAWPDPFGLPGLRAEIAGYLRRARGLAAAPEQVLVTRGVAGGLALLAAAVIRPGDRAGVEEPGYPSARDVLTRAGAVVVPCRVDADGIVPDELPGDLRLLYTTPAHQYPLGGRLPVRRRRALTGWARATGAIIVEDDYDSEFRYDVAPLPSLRSMDPEVVVYLGTTSKMMTPAFGGGWLVAAPEMIATLAGLRASLGDRVAEPVQHALLRLLATGDLERHIRRMRLEYARRRAVIVSALSELDAGPRDGAGPAAFRLLGETAGLHVVLEFPRGRPAEPVIAAARQRGLALWPLSRYFAGPVTGHGLVLGYGGTSLARVRRASALLRALLRAQPAPR
ncbi:MAG: PLP-dependent aminotransferase family protein [Streptosporangiaceae bacterium]|nr:PLP-dependent aminotransferase family protein [Streptosporangiaceae bacterium]MBV9858434.1 PLP-dependent aminotransferase family protein [Streptosporangiaceae bacterium]